MEDIKGAKELKNSYLKGELSEACFQGRFITLCKDYSPEQLKTVIEEDYEHIISRSIQICLLTHIIDAYIKNNYSLESALSDLNQWAKRELNIDSIALDEVNAEYASQFDEIKQWDLFEEGTISSPSLDVIRLHLDTVYAESSFNETYLQKDCFQRMIISDILLGRVENKLVFQLLVILSKDNIAILSKKGNDITRFFLWVFDIENEDYCDVEDGGCEWPLEEEWEQITSFFHLLPDDKQVMLYKYLFYLKATDVEQFTVQELYERLTNNKYHICKVLQIVSYILNKKEDSSSAIITDKEFDHILYGDGNEQRSICNLFSFFIKCDGPNVLSFEGVNKDNYFTIGSVSHHISEKGSFLKLVFSNSLSYPYAESDQRFDPDPFIRDIVLDSDAEFIYRVIKALEENIPHIKKGSNTYLISPDYEVRVKEFMMRYHFEDHAQLFKNASPHSLIPLQHHYREEYGNKTRIICEYTGCTKTDPNYGIPYTQCGRTSCVCRNLFLAPVFEWDSYSIVDLLYILRGRDKSLQQSVWNEYKDLAQSINRVIVKHLLIQENTTDVIERLKELLLDYDTHYPDIEDSEIKIVGDSDHEDEDDWNDFDFEDEKTNGDSIDDDSPTYERYRGSWAQEEEGYSDEEIDTIFDGDPSAYWNID